MISKLFIKRQIFGTKVGRRLVTKFALSKTVIDEKKYSGTCVDCDLNLRPNK